MTSAAVYAWREPVGDAELERLHAAAFGHEPGVVPWGARLERHSLGWVTARRAGMLVGFVNLVGDGGAHAFVVDTCVAPDAQGEGIGRGLLERAVAEGRASGAEWLHVDFEEHLERFYLAEGLFRPTPAGLIDLTG